MDARDPAGPPSEARVGAKRAFFERIDAKLVAEGYAVSPPPAAPPPPPPPPALTFEAWAELSVRVAGAPAEDLAAALSARGLTAEVWKRLDDEYLRALSDDLRAARRERPALYDARLKEEQLRRRGGAASAEGSGASSPVVGPPLDGSAAPSPASPAVRPPVPAAFAGTAESPELVAAVFGIVGRMPFVPPPPKPAGQGKRPAKTEQSRVVPPRAGGQTMALDAGVQQRPTPTLPFAGSADNAGVVHVPPLDARQFVALTTELMLHVAQREETLRRYRVPTEAAFRALAEHWRHPGRRPELEAALAEFAVALHGQVLR